MVNLGDVTPEERRHAMALFEQLHPNGKEKTPSPRTQREPKRAPSTNERLGNEPTDSLEISEEARRSTFDGGIDIENTNDVYREVGRSGDADGILVSQDQWHSMDCNDLSDLLTEERPIVVAVVLNQIPVTMAANLVRLLPSELAIAATAIIPRLQLTPEDVLKEIHEHLHQRITHYQLPKKSSEQNLKRLQAILESAGAEFKDACVKNIVLHEPMIARRLGWSQASTPLPSATIYPASPSHPVESFAKPVEEISDAEEENPAAAIVQGDSIPSSDAPTILPFPSKTPARDHQDSGPALRMTFDELASLPLSDLASVFRASEPSIILLAISGASEEFYNKVQKMLHPRDAKRLRAKIVQMGPVQLRDIDRAQRHLCELATKMLATGQIGAMVSMTITAAA